MCKKIGCSSLIKDYISVTQYYFYGYLAYMPEVLISQNNQTLVQRLIKGTNDRIVKIINKEKYLSKIYSVTKQDRRFLGNIFKKNATKPHFKYVQPPGIFGSRIPLKDNKHYSNIKTISIHHFRLFYDTHPSVISKPYSYRIRKD